VDKVVLDSSAVLAVLRSEPGAASVLARLESSVISTVNLTEVLIVLSRDLQLNEKVHADIQSFLRDVRPFAANQFSLACEISARGRSIGLSLGDCACLALAQSLKLPVITADRAWKDLDLGIKIELIRE
jgi:ribonuclease VapC